MSGHVDAESLALCAEGLLSGRRSARIRSHVASCPECAAAQARLTEVPALLARVPPPPLPPGIAARLDAALSAEAARRAAPDPVTEQDRPAPARRPDARPRPAGPRGPRLRLPVAARVLAAAGVVVIAGGVSYVVAHSSSSSPASSGNSAAAPAPVSGPDRHSAANAPGAGQGTVSQFTVRQSGTSYRTGTFAAQAAGLLDTSSASLNRPGKVSGGLSRRAPSSSLIGCVDKVAGAVAVRAGEVKLVDQARYQRRPATVIVVQAAAAQPGVVYVAGPRCSASDADILARAPLPVAG
jgi:hypothetical protein